MKCPRCQTENPETKKFCRKCGTELSCICAHCGSKCLPDDEFCGECGHALREAKPTPVDYSKPQSYTPKFLADKILGARTALEGERKLVTVLFADVASFTAMSEKLDPDEVHQIMDGCFKILLDQIHRYEGTVDKFAGDGMMALFGAPVAHEDHAQRACHAALGIQRAIAEYGEKVKRDCGAEFKMRIGLNSGLVIVGSVGYDLRMDYFALGDTTNLASRMQSLAQPGSIVVALDTYRLTKAFFKFSPLGQARVKGKEAAVETYELVGVADVKTRLEAAVVGGLTRFVGRVSEIAALKEAVEKARSGSGQIMGIVGEAGVGKSRLVLELRRMIPEDSCIWLEGRCLQYGGSIPHLPFVEMLRAYFDIKEADREFVVSKKIKDKIAEVGGQLDHILTPLRDVLSLKVDDQEYARLDPRLRRDRIFEAVRDLLISESRRRPLILAFDDLQWIDRSSNELLDYLIGWLANSHILLILVYRPEYTHQWSSRSYYGQIRVDHLSAGTSAELVLSILEEAEVASEVRELILTRGTGNPLFMEEFTRALLQNGSIRKKDHQWVLDKKTSDIRVPDTIQGIIAARMDRLEENLKQTMQVASVIGRDFAYRILQTITGTHEELKSYLVNLQGLEFIYEKNLFPELEYVFKHALTQEVAYNSLLLQRKKEIHERIGEAIEKLYADRLEEFYEVLAHHYSRSGNMGKAYQYCMASAIKVGFRYSLWEAFRFGREAIGFLDQMPQNEENKRRGIADRLLLAFVMMGLGYPEDSLEILQEGERLAKEVGDEGALAQFWSHIGMCYVTRGEATKGREYGENAFRRAEAMQDVGLMAPIGCGLCLAFTLTGEFLRVAEVAAEVVALLESNHRESESFGLPYNPYCQLLVHHGAAMGWLGDFEAGSALCERALRLALEDGNWVDICWAELQHSILLCVKGDGISALHHAENAVKHGEATEMSSMLPGAWLALGWAHALLGDLEKAFEFVRKGLQLQTGTGTAANLSSFYLLLADLHFDSGDLAEALGCAQKALELAQKNGEKHHEALSRAQLGRALGSTDPAKAEENILAAIEVLGELQLRPSQSYAYLDLGQLQLSLGRTGEALENLGKAQKAFAEMRMDFWLAVTQSTLDSARI
jgi:class 3 adenylate cyclase/tetratricopeptide (TPR) repeat protein